jgi:23S rRNA (guanosine2251-2'-O)-methyltransferase
MNQHDPPHDSSRDSAHESSRDSQRGHPETLVFGRHPVEEALRSEGAVVHEVAIVKGRTPADRKQLRRLTSELGIPFREISREEMTRWTDAPRHDQGVAARVRLLKVTDLDAFLAGRTGRAAREPARILALDGVTNSQNVGMVVRSVVGAGLDGLLWPMAGQPWINGLVVRAAAGAIFECPIVCCETLAIGIGKLQGAGFVCTGLDSGAQRSLFAVPASHRAAFVLGGEALGMSQEVRGMLDACVSIPMAGRLESLNVAVTAGLVAYHAAGLLVPESASRG